MRKPYMIANWKMHGTLAEVGARIAPLCAASKELMSGACIMVCPPYIHIASAVAAGRNSPLQIGAQNVSRHTPMGAYTGEISAHMLKEVGCTATLVGHSERRVMHRETDAIVAKKFAAAMAAGLTPVLCVGEHQSERHSGDAERVVGLQLSTVFAQVPMQTLVDTLWVLAYEPIWAIGSKQSAMPQDAEDMHCFLRAELDKRAPGLGVKTPILYGGSITAANAAAMFAMPNVDGGLVGGSSLHTDEFISICKSLPGAPDSC